VCRWVQRFTALLVDAARHARHCHGDRWHVDETYVKVAGVWRYVYRAIDQHGRVCCIERKQDRTRFWLVTSSMNSRLWMPPRSAFAGRGVQIRGDRAGGAQPPPETDAWTRTDRTAQVIIAGHAFMRNLRRGFYEITADTPTTRRIATGFTTLAQAI
jgi:DDE superfamily endonuclease